MSEEIGEACSPSALDAPVAVTSGSSEAEKREFFTVVFEGDIRAVKGNPFHIDTPYGRPVAIGRGDAFAEIDRLEQGASQ